MNPRLEPLFPKRAKVWFGSDQEFIAFGPQAAKIMDRTEPMTIAFDPAGKIMKILKNQTRGGSNIVAFDSQKAADTWTHTVHGLKIGKNTDCNRNGGIELEPRLNSKAGKK